MKTRSARSKPQSRRRSWKSNRCEEISGPGWRKLSREGSPSRLGLATYNGTSWKSFKAFVVEASKDLELQVILARSCE